MRRGRFITLEGGEGAGKTTLTAALARVLAERGVGCLTTREPGGAPGAEAIRDLLVTGAGNRWDPMSEVLLFLAARREHWLRRIDPALAAGTWVLCDRFSDSTVAYQGAALGLTKPKVQALTDAALGPIRPDLTLIVDVDPELGLARAAARRQGRSRYEAMAIDRHRLIRQAFLDIAADDPGRCAVLDGSRSAADVAEAALSVLDGRLGP